MTLKGSDAQVYYAFPEQEEVFTEEWATTHIVAIIDTLKGWWEELEKFKSRKDQEYPAESLRKVYKLVAAMLFRIYGHPDATTFNGTWVSLMDYVTMHSTQFNWASMLVASLQTNISLALVPDDGYRSEFYMASYLLDDVYLKCHFKGWAHNYEPK